MKLVYVTPTLMRYTSVLGKYWQTWCTRNPVVASVQNLKETTLAVCGSSRRCPIRPEGVRYECSLSWLCLWRFYCIPVGSHTFTLYALHLSLLLLFLWWVSSERGWGLGWGWGFIRSRFTSRNQICVITIWNLNYLSESGGKNLPFTNKSE